MNCANCGNTVEPGVQQCPSCGNQICDNGFVYGSLALSWEEARKGGVHTVEMRNLINPIKVRVKPRVRSGEKIRVAGAMFRMEDESVLLAPVEITVHVDRRPLWQPVLAVLACVLLTAAASLGIMGLIQNGDQVQTTATQPSISANTGTLTTKPPTTATTAATQPDPATTVEPTTQPNEPATTEPSTQLDESVTTEPSAQPDEPATTEPSTEPVQTSVIPHLDKRLMLQQLSEEHLKIAETLYQANMDFLPSTEIPAGITVQEFWYLCDVLYYECPELMQFELYGTCYYDDNGMVTSYELAYAMTEPEYRRMYNDCVEVVNSILDATQGMTVWEKEAYVYDYIVANCTYDLYKDLAGKAYGTLVQKIAKCDGISYAVKWIMEEMGITCLVAGGGPKQGEIGHVWNYVELEGNFYCLDVTADVPKEGSECPPLYGIYNAASDVAGRDFILYDVFQKYVQPPVVTTMEKSYHAENGDYYWKGQDWKAGLKQKFQAALETKEDVFIQFEDQSEYQFCLNTLGDVLNGFWNDAGMPKNVKWMWWFNDGYNVIRIIID